MTDVGYGRTYEEAFADAKDLLSIPRPVRVPRTWSEWAMVMVMPFILSALRPGAGMIFFGGFATLILLINGLRDAGAHDLSSAIRIVVAIVFLFAWIFVPRSFDWAERWESRGLYALLARRPGLGRLVHIGLYIYTIAGSYLFTSMLLDFISSLLGGNILDPNNPPGPKPSVVIGVWLAASAIALVWRYTRHPFVRHLTLSGALKGAASVTP